MSVRFRLSVSRLFDRVSVSVDLVSVCDRVEITKEISTRSLLYVRYCTVRTVLYKSTRPTDSASICKWTLRAPRPLRRPSSRARNASRLLGHQARTFGIGMEAHFPATVALPSDLGFSTDVHCRGGGIRIQTRLLLLHSGEPKASRPTMPS